MSAKLFSVYHYTNSLINATFGSGKKIVLTEFRVNQVYDPDLIFSLNLNFIVQGVPA